MENERLGSNGAFPHLEIGLRRRFLPEIVVLAKTRRFIFVIFACFSSFPVYLWGSERTPFSCKTLFLAKSGIFMLRGALRLVVCAPCAFWALVVFTRNRFKKATGATIAKTRRSPSSTATRPPPTSPIKTTEVAAIYPITPSSNMGEWPTSG
jgi:hypothetical protein